MAGHAVEALSSHKRTLRNSHQHADAGSAAELCRAKESERLQAVLENPQFRADPIAAVTKHLQATLPPAPSVENHSSAGGGKWRRQQGRQPAAESMMEQ